MKKSKIIEYIKSPKKIWNLLVFRNIIPVSDEKYLKMKYKFVFKKDLDLKNPKTFNEKLQWLKLNDRKPIYTTMVDKYEVKKYVANIIGREHIIPTIGIYNKFNDIDFNILPNKFVIKCTHDSGGTVICKDKNNFNIKEAKKKINKSLRNNYYKYGREWPYKNVKPRILIEKYMEDNSGALLDYKIYAFNGKCDYVMICLDREKLNEKTKFLYYDRNWNLKKDFSNDGLKYGNEINLEKPKNLEKMFEFANKLSSGIPFVRVDFYNVDGQIYFGELTFFPSGGFDNKRTISISNYLDENLKINDIN